MEDFRTVLNCDLNDEENDELNSFISTSLVPSMVKEPASSTGPKWFQEMLATRSKAMFRMDRHVFYGLCRTLVDHHGLTQQNVGVEEMVAMFLFTVGHGVGNRVVQAISGQTGENVSSFFHLVLNACISLSKQNVKACDRKCRRKRSSPADSLCFHDAIGAIDGTHIKCVPPATHRRSRLFLRNKYSPPTQNVMAVCDWDMCFTFVLAGWHGSVHDNTVFEHAVTDTRLNFPHPPPGKYYLVDSAYSTPLGYLGPYKKGQPGEAKANKIFNCYHSGLRMTIERTFGVWKSRFHVLRKMPPYDYNTQIAIVCATMALHNFITENEDNNDSSADEQPSDEADESDSDDEQPSASTNNFGSSESEMSHIRDKIRDELIIHLG